MEKFALLTRVVTKPDMEATVATFLKTALPLAEAEPEPVK